MAVDITHHVPLVGLEALRRVVGKPAGYVPVDGNAVVVPESDELAQAHATGERAGFVGDALHQATVAHEHPGAVVNDVVDVAVKAPRQHLFCQGHANRVGDTLAQWAGGRLHAGGFRAFRVPGRLRVQLAEIPDLRHGQIVTAEMQDGIQQHGRVAVGQHEAIPVPPIGVGRVVLQEIIPQDFGNIGHAHRCTGVAGVGVLNGIHGQRADGVCKVFT